MAIHAFGHLQENTAAYYKEDALNKVISGKVDGPLDPLTLGMIFGTRARPRVMSSKCSDDFRKMDPCKGKVNLKQI